MARDICLNQDYINHWKDDLKSVHEGESIRIVSGEAFWQLFECLKQSLVRARKKLGVTIKMITGPIISVDEKSANAILELAEEGIIELWISPFRQQSHYRIFGRRFLYKESYHVALSPERHGEYIYDSFGISKYIYDFDNLIAALYMRPYGVSELVSKKTNDEIVELQKTFGKNYDFLISKTITA